MYLEYFGLKSPPFRLTAHPDFFFSGAGRGALLDALLYSITSGEGLIKVTGEVGAGKTMLCRMLLERLPAHVDAIFLPNPALSEDELLLTLADELKIQFHTDRASQKIRLIEETLIAKYAAGRQVVLIVDEAHAMPKPTLELVRLLSNLDSEQHKLLQIVLFGQLELDDILQHNELRALRERISYSLLVPELSVAEVGDYLSYRLFVAGHQGNAIFTPVAIKHIAQVAQGLSRRVNLLADKAMLAAFSENATQVNLKHAKLAERECQYSRVSEKKKYLLVMLLVLTFAIVLGSWHFFARQSTEKEEKIAASQRLAQLRPLSSTENHSGFSEHNLGELIINSRDRIRAAEASSVTVLVSKIPSGQGEQLKRLIKDIDQQIGPGRIIIYPTRINGATAWGVLAGLYPDRQRAQGVKTRLRQDSKLRDAQVYTIGVLRNEMLLPRD